MKGEHRHRCCHKLNLRLSARPIEHRLDVGRIARLGERESQEDARLCGLRFCEATKPKESSSTSTLRDPAAPNPRAADDDCALLGESREGLLGALRHVPVADTREHETLSTGLGARINEPGIHIGVRVDDLHPREIGSVTEPKAQPLAVRRSL